MSSSSIIEPSSTDIEDDLTNVNSTTTESLPKISEIDIRFTIALAVPAGPPLPNDSSVTKNPTSKSKRTSEVSKVQGYYRVEYSLLPGAPNVAFDIVVFRTAAKIYPDGQKAFLIPVWEDDNENIWIVWTYIHKLELNHERLLALLSHKILVKIWDGRDFCTVRTKLDKPRITRAVPQSINGDEDNTPQNIVQNMAQNYADKWVAKPLLHKLQRRLPIHIPPPTAFLKKKIDDMEDARPSTPALLDALQEKSTESLNGDFKTLNTNQNLNPGILKKSLEKSETKPVEPVSPKKGTRSSNKQNEEKKANGTAQIIVPSNLIIAGFKMITCRLDDNPLLPKAIQDCFVSINIEDPQLMNEVLAKEFNPLTVTICYVENMPSTPLSYSELKERCDPVYCCYELFNQPAHQTLKKPQARHIYWNDFHLYLTNLINENLMSQFRNSPYLNIELHDRDECEHIRRRVASVFGSESTDESIGKVSGKLKLHNSKNDSNWNPHGCVKIDLSELWLGQTSLEFYIPVVPCHAPQLLSGRASNANHTLSDEHTYIQQGDFLSSGTQMKILVKLAKPFVPPVEHRLLDDRELRTTTVAPFNRIVFIFPYNNMTFLTALQTSIRIINAKALDFENEPAHIQVTTLSTYKLTDTQQADPNLNIITGFHLFDDDQHIFILEGRKEEAIDLLFETVPKPKGQNIEILYDSSVHFNERLYVKFGIDIMHIRLSRTLRNIVSQPLIFLRDNLTKETFEALDKLHKLALVHKLSSSARYKLFPTMEMVTSINKDYGIPLTENEIRLFARDDRLPPSSAPPPSQRPLSSTQAEEDNNIIQNTYSSNNVFIREQPQRSMDDTQLPDINFLARNKERIRLASLKNKENRPTDDSVAFVTSGPIYPYSTQKLNSAENALEQMRTYLKQNHPSASCSFNPEFPTHAYSAYSNEESSMDFHRKLRIPFDFNGTEKDKYSDKTLPSWVNYPGYRTNRETNVHSQLPDPYRLVELSKPKEEWYEPNIIDHQSPIHDRIPCKWVYRNDDFDRWKRAPPLSRSISVHWQSTSELSRSASLPTTPTLIVGDKRMHFLRRAAHTEMLMEGRTSSSQLDRLTGLLKDKPVKKGLLLPKSFNRDNESQSILFDT
ncbi:unnamed protein product [Adineta steineri]|uniref:DUF4550 domain-containing protein n=1 Tax=Adineta steineri TaxID=433720 RepID=A0A813MIU6_9BILA|nr:unnamed protein product [Adineta steineri]CAF1142263.1 unnamed protein product [Adineta steineri]